MPQIAPAARVSTSRRTRFNPATSTTDGMSTRSLSPTYIAAAGVPAAVETQSLGTPIGSARIAAVTTAEPPVPPMPMTPSNRPWSCSRRTTAAAPALMTFIASPRSCFARSAANSPPPARASSSASMSTGNKSVVPSGPVLAATTSQPLARMWRRRKSYSAPFVSNEPSIRTMGIAVILTA